ncbi:TBC-domain-containing protein [Coemansia reversa NRRL 1564]|uniref:TBC-domain-containing protein n=1 Tax=Coemansia reversa (strain ATCC 12441 / NRRL 1564) TaxID=763665 RepID=A0A2G5B2F7_COERN|nr:TBC-domain-containing protein [Coemansia reversa NRRL 1564]|eukprot:PIA13199.1 TBC-domain-containing protein [Coemansia reversa NRRL 1564]
MTPRMLELSRRLSDIEFQEYIPSTPVLSPSAFSRPATRRRGSIAELLGTSTGSRPTSPYGPISPVQRAPIIEEDEDLDDLIQSRPRSPPPRNPRLQSSPRARGEERVTQRLRDRLKVPISEPSKLGGLDLVEPAKVDVLYEEDKETLEYRRRRRARESIGSSEGFSVDITLQRRRAGSGQNSPTSPSFSRTQQAASTNARLPKNSASDAADRPPPASERRKLVGLTRRMHEDWDEVGSSLRELRVLVASNGGLPVGVGSGAARLRSMMWLAMLEVRGISLDGYSQALQCCPSSSADKINNDAFRTLAADAEFRRAVPTESIVRVLNALLSAPDRSTSDPPRYVQGMNTLLAPFLYVMGESAGFYAFRQFLRNECPLYARPSLPGVHACVQLVDECLATVDARLFSHLKQHGAVAKIYAFPAAMTLSASVGPLRQVVRLWDFLLAFGVHLNVVCIVAQLLSMRELLLTTQSPMAFLRSWPPLRADAVIRRTREIYELLPERLRRKIKLHAHDTHLAEKLASAPSVADPIAEPKLWSQQQLSPGTPSHTQSSLKRDLPLSPDIVSPTCSVDVLTNRSVSATSRPRSRTFSGMAKRLCTARPIPDPTLPSGVLRAMPNYGCIGLGIHSNNPPPPHISQSPELNYRALSNNALGHIPQLQPLSILPSSPPTRPVRMMAGSEALWLLDRKLSPNYFNNHH